VQASHRFRTSRPVCFSPDDYAGFWRRLTAELVDLVAVVLLGVIVTAIVVVVTPTDASGEAVLLTGWTALVYGYFVVLKRSPVRTLGYWVTRVHIVDMHGRPPGLGPLTVRLLFAVAGPLNVILDMMWIPSDRHRQSLRDKVAHTYVVKTRARPAGPALLVYRQYSLMGMSLLLQELEPLDAEELITLRRAARPR
jgi:uncharacterized RDD family membrane protein YckC